MMTTIKAANRKLTFFALRYVPLIFFCRPKVIEITDSKIVIKMKLNWLTKNHLNSMYFGALCIGADVAAGLMAFIKAEQQQNKISFAFKDLHAEFLQRPESDVYFICQQGELISEMLQASRVRNERVNQVVTVKAYCHLQESPVAQFQLTLSIKVL